MDGFWVGAPTFRGLPLEIRREIVANANTRDTVVEMPIEMARTNESNLVAAIEAGMNVHTLMIYKEPGSLLSQSEINEMKEKYRDRYTLIVSIRRFEEVHKTVLRDMEGFSFEFQVRTDPAFLDNVASAIRWGLDSGKTVYLLTPPNWGDECSRDPCNPHYQNKNYLHDYQTMKGMLEDRIGWGRLHNSNLRFVPANYAYWNTQVQVAPEHEILDRGVFNANTQTGAARWLILTKDSD